MNISSLNKIYITPLHPSTQPHNNLFVDINNRMPNKKATFVLLSYLTLPNKFNFLHLKLYIKYMVSNRCKMAVKEELKKLNLHFMPIELGEVEIMEDITPNQREELKAGLFQLGLELMDDKRAMLIEKIKTVIIEMIHHTDEFIKVNFSVYLSEKLNHDYTYLSNLFSEVQGTTIEQFIISHKVERIKELIIYGELNITEIAWKLNYSSVAHLSNQFKKVTGLTPSHFKQMKSMRRNPIEDIGNLPNINS